MSKGKKVGIILGSVIGGIIIIGAIAVAVAPEQTYTLSVSASPSGGGSVSSSSGEYEPGVQVTVTANPSSGYIFDHWSGSASGTTPTITITMNSDKTLTAHFESTATMYMLTISINPSAAGSVSPSGGEYESGDQVTLTASPASGYTFDYWSGASSGTTSTATITMDSDKAVTANFRSASTVTVNYEVITRYSSAYLSVRVEGPQNSYEILLFDPEGERVGYGYISSDDMLTGHETVEVSMQDIGVTNPAPGEYWLIVREWLPEKTVFEARPIFEGPDINITDAQFETESYGYSEGGYITEATIQVHNSGDLPVFPDEIKYMLAGRQEDSTIYESLPHGETTIIEDWALYISELEKGTHQVTVEIYSEGVKLDTYETQVEIG